MALLEGVETKKASLATTRRSNPEYYAEEEDEFITHSAASMHDADGLLEPQLRTPPAPSRCRENPQPIVGTMRFDTTPVDDIN